MQYSKSLRLIGAVATLLAVGGCGQRQVSHPRISPRPVGNAPRAPQFGTHPVAAINRNLGPGETLWHLRAGLNVAAISCRSNRSVASAYNRMLNQHRAALAIAANSEQVRFGAGAAAAKLNDRHQTQLYNFFAGPRGQARLCQSAGSVLSRINAMSAAELNQAAPRVLAEVEAPFI